jgi:hypothetical protein
MSTHALHRCVRMAVFMNTCFRIEKEALDPMGSSPKMA